MCAPRYFVLSLFASFWPLIFMSKLSFLLRMEKTGKLSWRYLFLYYFLLPTCLGNSEQCSLFLGFVLFGIILGCGPYDHVVGIHSHVDFGVS
jgi:hypothetical protein